MNGQHSGGIAMKLQHMASIPDNGKPVPDGAVFVKIEWEKARSTVPYGATVPGNLTEVAFIVKNSKRFPNTDGWGYATFQYARLPTRGRRKATLAHRATRAIRSQSARLPLYALPETVGAFTHHKPRSSR
jgi:cytochrome P460